MTLSELPLQPQNQSFSATISGSVYKFRVIWRGGCWYLDLSDSNDSLIVGSMPLVTGSDLLGQYAHLGLGFSLFIVCNDDAQSCPTEYDLGTGSHLIVRTE